MQKHLPELITTQLKIKPQETIYFIKKNSVQNQNTVTRKNLAYETILAKTKTHETTKNVSYKPKEKALITIGNKEYNHVYLCIHIPKKIVVTNLCLKIPEDSQEPLCIEVDQP